MRAGIHPDYRPVVFKDASSDYAVLQRSTKASDQTIVWSDGREYPLITIDISSASHPFFTGQEKRVDAAGRIERFEKRYRAS